MSWSPGLTDRNVEIVEKTITRLTWNSLEQKNNYLISGALQKKVQYNFIGSNRLETMNNSSNQR